MKIQLEPTHEQIKACLADLATQTLGRSVLPNQITDMFINIHPDDLDDDGEQPMPIDTLIFRLDLEAVCPEP